MINSGSDINKNTDNLLKDIDSEFNQLKKSNYFGNKSEKEIKDSVDNVKEKYKDKIKQEKNQENKQEKDISKNQGNGSDKKAKN